MSKKTKKKKPVKKHHHLSPLEIQAIVDARARGAKVTDLAKQHGTSRQTIYNALRAAREASDEKSTGANERDGQVLPVKRRRSKRISPETKKEIADMKRKYPTWGVEYIREQWARAGKPPLSRSTIYKILRDAGLSPRQVVEKETFKRFEMVLPGQLWQVDFQGKIYLTGIGWVHGFAVLDDHSRYCPVFRYFLKESMSNAILMLNEAIENYGVPEAIYVDNGTQFKSRGERLNNFELFCVSYSIKITNTPPRRPQGKGKIERFFGTVENQFIAWVRVKIEEQPGYSLGQLNKDLKAYLNDQYHARVHGGTKETPSARFFKVRLRAPDPPVDVVKFLERSATRRVNKFGEVSYSGYKIQVVLPARAKVTVVETIETIRIEYCNRLVREINRHDLSKNPPVKRQQGINVRSPVPSTTTARKKAPGKKGFKGGVDYKPDDDGYYHRKTSNVGRIRCAGGIYFIGRQHGDKQVLVKIIGDKIHVFDDQRNIICTLDELENKAKKKGVTKKPQGSEDLANKQPHRDKVIGYKIDDEGYYHRKTDSGGRFRCAGGLYCIDRENGKKEVLVKISGDKLHVFDGQRNPIRTLDVKVKKRE